MEKKAEYSATTPLTKVRMGEYQFGHQDPYGEIMRKTVASLDGQLE